MTAISWTDETWNPTVGCSRVSPGCINCYAEHAAAMVNRTQGARSVYLPVLKYVNGDPRWNGEVKLIPDRLDHPFRWKRRRRIFVNSMSDLFHEELSNEAIAAVFGAMAAAPWHTFQILTKRAGRMREWFAWVERAARECNGGRGMTPAAFGFCHAQKAYVDGSPNLGQGEYPLSSTIACRNGLHAAWPLPNVWLGVSVENQEAADERIPHLLATPATIRFLSCEPLLDEVQLEEIKSFAGLEKVLDPECWGDCRCDSLWGYDPGCLRNGGDGRLTRKIDWVIVGVESGAGARPCEVDWLRLLRDQCAAAGTTFFLKQAVGGADVVAGDGSRRKKGNVIELPYLDGVQHAAFPEEARVA